MEQQQHQYLQTHQISGDVLSFDVREEDAALQLQAAQSREGRASKTLVKQSDIRVTLLALSKGQTLEDHYAPGACTLQGVRGHLRVQVGDQTTDVTPGRVIALDSEVRHRVEAAEDGSLLLTVAMP